MNDFLQNVGANLVGTFAGAALAVFTTWAIDRRNRRRNNEKQLQSLIDRIYRSRALAPHRTRPPGPLTPAEQLDFERCSLSVIGTRDRIALVSDELHQTAQVTEVLNDMYAECLTYLEASEAAPENYLREMMTLRGRLDRDLRKLCALVPSLAYRAPGTAIFGADAEERLRKLDELHAAGMIDESEFAEKRLRILDEGQV